MIRFLLSLLMVAAVLLAGACPPAMADMVTGGGGFAVPMGAGVGNSPTVFNPGTGGSQQSIVTGTSIFLQSSLATKTANYTLNSELGGVSDCARTIKANGAASIQFTAPNPVGTLCVYVLADQSGHGYTVTTPSGAAHFYGCVAASPTTLTVPANNTVALQDDGTNYFCAFQTQTQAAQVNQSQTWGPQYSQACTISPSGGVFTPSCPISYINITGPGQHIAPPNFMPPNTASTFVNLVITYGSGCTSSALCTPIFDGNPDWPGAATPPACAPTATVPVTVACFSSVALPSGNGDWLEGRSVDATHIGYGLPLTNMGPATSVAWNPLDKAPNITLSNGNLTASDSATGTGYSVVRATNTPAKTTGKRHFEFTATVGFTYVGVANGSTSLSAELSTDTNSIAVNLGGSGPALFTKYNGIFTTYSVSGFAQTDTIAIELDLNNKLLWVEDVTANSGWSNGAGGFGGNPGSGTGGTSFSSTSLTGGMMPAVSFYEDRSASVTANFGATPFAGTVSSGFVSWQSP